MANNRFKPKWKIKVTDDGTVRAEIIRADATTEDVVRMCKEAFEALDKALHPPVVWTPLHAPEQAHVPPMPPTKPPATEPPDAVEVVRCKGCQRYHWWDVAGCMVCELDDYHREPDHFCGFGVRIGGAPAADVVDALPGEWVWDVEQHGDPMYGIDEDYGYRCSVCHVWADAYGVDGDIYGEPPTHILHYCPNCGAKMYGKEAK